MLQCWSLSIPLWPLPKSLSRLGRMVCQEREELLSLESLHHQYCSFSFDDDLIRSLNSLLEAIFVSFLKG